MNLSELNLLIKKCDGCDLSDESNIRVLGSGSNTPIYIFVTETPLRSSQRDYDVFNNESGQLLQSMLNHFEMDLSQCYFTNVCRCRPPISRTPHQSEIEVCLPFLKKELQILQLKCIS